MILAFSSRKEAELEVSLITDLTDNEQDQIKLMGKLQMIGLQNANFCFELFSTVLTSSIIDKLLDILYFSKILKFDASSLINSFCIYTL